MLVPVIGLVPNGFQSIADRYTYIPSIGLFWRRWGLPEVLVRRKALVLFFLGAAALVLLALG